MAHFQPYFEGWYFKHRIGGRVFAAIPGLARDARGQAQAFVQVISNEGSRCFSFPASDYRAVRAPLSVSVGENRFTAKGVRLNLPGIEADLRYGPLTKLTGGDIMGPFARMPLMECRHGVDSLLHDVRGFVRMDGEMRSFEGGSGYIERDWGRSFPRSWTWLECHGFKNRPGDSILLAIAEIPMLGLSFTGLLCVCRVAGIQHRIATYRGARLLLQRFEGGHYHAEVRQMRYALEADVRCADGSALQAPLMGAMNRVITEYPSCDAHVRLTLDGKQLLDAHGTGCGFECAR